MWSIPMKWILLLSSLLSMQLCSGSEIEIHIHCSAEPFGTLTPFLIGANNPMPSMVDRADYDPLTGLFPEPFINAVRKTGIQSLRFPGGNVSGSYFWKNGLGPLEDRPAGFDGSTGYLKEDYYWFGFLEFMDFLRSLETSDPIICVNFGLASAAEAADWVEFANANTGVDPNGDGVNYAQWRADLGIPEPFHIRYWEIGNELGIHYNHMFSWHFGQRPDGSEDDARTIRNYLFGGSQWQYQDMDNSQQGQRVVKNNNWSVNAAISNGQPGQSFFVKYPPVDPDSFHLALCGDALWGPEWMQIDNLSGAAPEDPVFQLDPVTGEITFGNGTQGAIPPSGQSVRIKYKSVNQEGLIDFYSAMKQADPSVYIGVPFSDNLFFEEVEAAAFDVIPFDFITEHPYDSGQDLPLASEHWRIHAFADRHETNLQNHRSTLDVLSHGQKTLGIWISEYNLVYRMFDRTGKTSNPWYGGRQLDFFGRSLDQGLYIAGALTGMLNQAFHTGLLGLNIHALLTDSDTALADWPVTGMIGPSPVFYLNPSALIYSQLSQSLRHTIVASDIINGPVYHLPVQDIDPEGREGWESDTLHIPYLKSLATVSPGRDTLRLYVLNRASGLQELEDEYGPIEAAIHMTDGPEYNQLTLQEMNAPSLWSIMTAENADIKLETLYEGNENLPYTHCFSDHSWTLLTWTCRSSNGVHSGKPDGFCLYPIAPNPFNESARIRYYLPKSGHIKLEVFNLRGEKIETLLDEAINAGAHTFRWNGTKLANNMYLIRLTAGRNRQHRKCLLLK